MCGGVGKFESLRERKAEQDSDKNCKDLLEASAPRHLSLVYRFSRLARLVRPGRGLEGDGTPFEDFSRNGILL